MLHNSQSKVSNPWVKNNKRKASKAGIIYFPIRSHKLKNKNLAVGDLLPTTLFNTTSMKVSLLQAREKVQRLKRFNNRSHQACL
jgi:hypothetical protein